MTPEEVANRFDAFRQYEAAGRSAVYEELSSGVTGDADVQDLICRGPRLEPTLFFAAAKHLGAPYDDGWHGFRAFVLDRGDDLLEVMASHRTQTNEVARCATILPLLAGLPQPLALLEVGASAGLCLLPDRYGYRYDDTLIAGGPPVLGCRTVGPTRPPLPSALPEVAWRRGIDLEPLDVTDPDDVRWLEALVWPGQVDRERHLREALETARESPPEVIRADLTEALEDVAADAPADATLVVFHTAVLGYVSAAERADFARRVQALDAAWIASEAPGVLGEPTRPGALLERGHFVVTVGGILSSEEPVARMGPHGDWIEWAGSASPPLRWCTGR